MRSAGAALRAVSRALQEGEDGVVSADDGPLAARRVLSAQEVREGVAGHGDDGVGRRGGCAPLDREGLPSRTATCQRSGCGPAISCATVDA